MRDVSSHKPFTSCYNASPSHLQTRQSQMKAEMWWFQWFHEVSLHAKNFRCNFKMQLFIKCTQQTGDWAALWREVDENNARSKFCPHNFNCKAATPFHNSKIKCVRVSASVTSITLPQHNFLIDNLRSKEWRVSRHPGMRRWWIFYKVFSTENQTQIRREPILTPEYREWSRLPVTLTYSRHWISCSGGRRCPPAAPWR